LHLKLPLAGQDATEAFFGLHRIEVLEKPQYQRLQIGVIEGEESIYRPLQPGELSKVPHGEPTWLSEGYFSPYYTEVGTLVVGDVADIDLLVESPAVPEGNA